MKKCSKALFVLSLLAAVMLGGNAWADTPSDHVSVAPNGKGDLLFFPAYFTGGGWETKLTVINTSQTKCVVAKVVFRSVVSSIELRDFIIFLSPADVWTGVVYELDGRGHIRSTDDSVLNLAGDFASPLAPLDVVFEDPCTNGDVSTTGYVEIIEGMSYTPIVNSPVPKSTIFANYDAWLNNDFTADLPVNVLAGNAEARNHQNALGFGINAIVMKNYDNTQKIQVAIPTVLGDDSGSSLGEVEAALSKNQFAIPYYLGSLGGFLGTVTFPTKLAYPDEPVLCRPPTQLRSTYVKFPTPTFSPTVYDLKENTFIPTTEHCIVSPCLEEQIPINSFPQELNFIGGLFAAVDFEEGWLLIQINESGAPTTFTTDNNTTGTYTGAPAIATFIRYDVANGFATWGETPYTLGTVQIGTGDEGLQYHFWEQLDN